MSRPLPLACIFSVEGETLTQAEKSLFSAAQPFGFILFGRNCRNREQIKKLTDELRSTVGWNCPITIDQEGGRIARLRAPEWPEFLPARQYGEKIECGEGDACLDADMGALARMLTEIGIDTNCAPVCDVLFPETHDIIGDRAYSTKAEVVAEAAAATCRAFIREGVQPIIKHIPGHGRATADSHLDLPVVNASLDELKATDFHPFRYLSSQSFGPSLWGMTAHILFSQIDPDLPATLSKPFMDDIIRGWMGFDGLLMSDDLDMKALDKYGSLTEKANLSLQAGCDVALYCWAKMQDMEKLAADLPPLSARGWARWEKSVSFHVE